ncbi:hypothetical protein ACTM8Z_00155 [Atopobiaceae bacterium HCP3S3_D6]
MRDRQIDLDRHLFAELERLGDESLSGEELRREVERAKAVSVVAQQVNASRALELKAMRLIDGRRDRSTRLPGGFREGPEDES